MRSASTRGRSWPSTRPSQRSSWSSSPAKKTRVGLRIGPALDLGTGSAVWGVELAKRGWQVTGIDIVAKAVHRARARIQASGVEMRLVHGDVTALREAGVGDGFRLLLDTGTFHGLSDAQRIAMGREVSAVAAPAATLILDCFAPRHRGPLPRGASRDDIERAFPDWEITDMDAADTDPDPVARLFRFEERFYRLRRSDDGAA